MQQLVSFGLRAQDKLPFPEFFAGGKAISRSFRIAWAPVVPDMLAGECSAYTTYMHRLMHMRNLRLAESEC